MLRHAAGIVGARMTEMPQCRQARSEMTPASNAGPSARIGRASRRHPDYPGCPRTDGGASTRALSRPRAGAAMRGRPKPPLLFGSGPTTCLVGRSTSMTGRRGRRCRKSSARTEIALRRGVVLPLPGYGRKARLLPYESAQYDRIRIVRSGRHQGIRLKPCPSSKTQLLVH